MSKRKSTKHCCFVLFLVRLAHSYPNGAPLVAITGQVGTDRMQLHDLYADPPPPTLQPPVSSSVRQKIR